MLDIFQLVLLTSLQDLFWREVPFETNLDLRKHPQQVFWIFFSFVKYLNLALVDLSGVGGGLPRATPA